MLLSLAMPKYECDQCGACCKHLIVEADDLDLLREPRLIESDPHWAGKMSDRVLTELQNDFGKALVIACGANRPCTFLGADDRCSIYPTRPNACVAFEAGDEQCQEARRAQGLPSLQVTAEKHDGS
ncbi:MAG: YkgJ family cysteine cluster protein [Planctomycetes bacterium]|nr:YkgJ family cysteine cluster protein [Planctomycetota bacterium]